MSHTSPASFLVWAILSTLLGAFLFFHLWSFDRFKCLKWNNGPYSGAFKRIMTYSYLISVPLIMAYSIGFAVIKYRQGFLILPEIGVVAMPYQLWPKSQQNLIFPLYLLFSVGWSLEMITHLEELCFWLFLVNAGSAQQDWFRSLYFKTWAVGSVVAVVYMPLVTIFTRQDVLKCEAYTFLAGSLGSLSLTLWFTPILWTFPSFLRNLKREGVDINTIVRLTKFHELNTLRVFFRFLFTLPLLCMAIDGVRPHQHVNESMFWTDILAVTAGFGCVISSGITLVIFFPRSIEGEIAAKDATKERKLTASRVQQSMLQSQTSGGALHTIQSNPASAAPFFAGAPAKGDDEDLESAAPSPRMGWAKRLDEVPPQMPPRYTSTQPQPYSNPMGYAQQARGAKAGAAADVPPMRPNRRNFDGGDVELGGIGGGGAGGDKLGKGGLTEGNLSRHNQRHSRVNHLVHNFKSPIDLAYAPDEEDAATPRFTFSPRR